MKEGEGGGEGEEGQEARPRGCCRGGGGAHGGEVGLRGEAPWGCCPVAKLSLFHATAS
jgi:hypothetical protein